MQYNTLFIYLLTFGLFDFLQGETLAPSFPKELVKRKACEFPVFLHLTAVVSLGDCQHFHFCPEKGLHIGCVSCRCEPNGVLGALTWSVMAASFRWSPVIFIVSLYMVQKVWAQLLCFLFGICNYAFFKESGFLLVRSGPWAPQPGSKEDIACYRAHCCPCPFSGWGRVCQLTPTPMFALPVQIVVPR